MLTNAMKLRATPTQKSESEGGPLPSRIETCSRSCRLQCTTSLKGHDQTQATKGVQAAQQVRGRLRDSCRLGRVWLRSNVVVFEMLSFEPSKLSTRHSLLLPYVNAKEPTTIKLRRVARILSLVSRPYLKLRYVTETVNFRLPAITFADIASAQQKMEGG